MEKVHIGYVLEKINIENMINKNETKDVKGDSNLTQKFNI